MAPESRGSPGADPSNLWGNAREGSAVPATAQKDTAADGVSPGAAQAAVGSEAVSPGAAQGDDRRAAPPAADQSEGEGILLQGVSRWFTDRSGGCVEALSNVCLTINPSTTVAIVGPSGCGKSTLLELLCRLQQPSEGSITAPQAALMPQRDLLLPWLSALDNAALPLRIAGARRAEAREKTHPLFARLGLAGFERARPGELSGGMRQRVAFLRTLMSGRPLLCLDEPFGALDAITRIEMQSWLSEVLQQQPRTVVLVTHDVEEAVLLGDRVIVLSARPGSVLADIEVALAHPRARSDEAVLALRERALIALGLEPAGGRR